MLVPFEMYLNIPTLPMYADAIIQCIRRDEIAIGTGIGITRTTLLRMCHCDTKQQENQRQTASLTTHNFTQRFSSSFITEERKGGKDKKKKKKNCTLILAKTKKKKHI
jgi:hypothetical protein